MIITRINHCCFEIEHEKTRLIVDPFFTQSDVSMIKPVTDFDIDREKLSLLRYDALFISHAHIDHYSRVTLELFCREITVYLPRGDRLLQEEVEQLGFKQILFLEPFEKVEVGAIKVVATPSEAMNVELGFLFEACGSSFWHTVDTVLSLRSLERLKTELPARFVGAFTYKFLNEAKQREVFNQIRMDDKYFEDSLLKGAFFSDQTWICLDQGWESPFNPAYTKHYQPLDYKDVIKKLEQKGVDAIFLMVGDALDLKTMKLSKGQLPAYIKTSNTANQSQRKDMEISWDIDSDKSPTEKKNFLNKEFLNVFEAMFKKNTQTSWYENWKEKNFSVCIEVFVENKQSMVFSYDFQEEAIKVLEDLGEADYMIHYKTCFGAIFNVWNGVFDYGNLAAAGLIQIKLSSREVKFFDFAKLLIKPIKKQNHNKNN